MIALSPLQSYHVMQASSELRHVLFALNEADWDEENKKSRHGDPRIPWIRKALSAVDRVLEIERRIDQLHAR